MMRSEWKNTAIFQVASPFWGRITVLEPSAGVCILCSVSVPDFLPRGPQSSALLDIPTGLSTSPNSDKTEAANTDADIEDGLVETVGEGEGKV